MGPRRDGHDGGLVKYVRREQAGVNVIGVCGCVAEGVVVADDDDGRLDADGHSEERERDGERGKGGKGREGRGTSAVF